MFRGVIRIRHIPAATGHILGPKHIQDRNSKVAPEDRCGIPFYRLLNQGKSTPVNCPPQAPIEGNHRDNIDMHTRLALPLNGRLFFYKDVFDCLRRHPQGNYHPERVVHLNRKVKDISKQLFAGFLSIARRKHGLKIESTSFYVTGIAGMAPVLRPRILQLLRNPDGLCNKNRDYAVPFNDVDNFEDARALWFHPDPPCSTRRA